MTTPTNPIDDKCQHRNILGYDLCANCGKHIDLYGNVKIESAPTNPTDPMQGAVKNMVVNTIENLAWQGYEKDQLLDLAKQIKDTDLKVSQCCPFCAETQCDEGCPLESLRDINKPMTTPTNPTQEGILLPCPFCGSNEVGMTVKIDLMNTFVRVECQSCNERSCREIFEDQAIAAWNTRANPTPAPSPIKAEPTTQAMPEPVATLLEARNWCGDGMPLSSKLQYLIICAAPAIRAAYARIEELQKEKKEMERIFKLLEYDLKSCISLMEGLGIQHKYKESPKTMEAMVLELIQKLRHKHDIIASLVEAGDAMSTVWSEQTDIYQAWNTATNELSRHCPNCKEYMDWDDLIEEWICRNLKCKAATAKLSQDKT